MPDIAAANVTTAVVNQHQQQVSQGRRQGKFSVAFGDGALTYPTGGVPITKAAFGCPNVIESFIFEGTGANGFVYKYDQANEKIRIYQGDNNNAADSELIELAGGSATPAAATLFALVIGW
jgi:hypothetical protein